MAEFKHDLQLSLLQRLIKMIELDHPVLVVGGPGTGKSQRAQQAARELGMEFVDVRLQLYDAVDIKGLPYIITEQLKQQVRWAMPDFVARSQGDAKVLLNYEEINCANVSTMNTALQFILDKRAGEHILGPNVRQVACCNAAEHRAHVNPMSAPLINRFMVLKCEPNLQEWMQWAMKNGIHEAVIGYLNYRAEALYQEPKKVQDEFSNFPTPRSWAVVSDLLYKDAADMTYLTGAIGEGAAVELCAYLQDRHAMPDIDKLLAGKIKWQPDVDKTKLSVVWAVIAAVGDRCVKDPTLIEPAAEYVLKTTTPEISSLFLSMLMNSTLKNVMKLITGSKGLSGWLRQHQTLISRAIGIAA